MRRHSTAQQMAIRPRMVLIRYWLTPSDDPACDEKVRDICALY